MYSAYKLNKQGDNIQPWRTPFLFGTSLYSMSSSKCCFLTCIQISQEADQVVWYSHLFQNFPQFTVIHTVKGIGIVNKAEIDIFLELSCVFHDPADVGNLICGSSSFSKTNLNIRKFTVHILLKPGLENWLIVSFNPKELNLEDGNFDGKWNDLDHKSYSVITKNWLSMRVCEDMAFVSLILSFIH